VAIQFPPLGFGSRYTKQAEPLLVRDEFGGITHPISRRLGARAACYLGFVFAWTKHSPRSIPLAHM
jgi:hypothetical protein